jgi:acetyltransferase-like isoleucine patch superfamily enzyme
VKKIVKFIIGIFKNIPILFRLYFTNSLSLLKISSFSVKIKLFGKIYYKPNVKDADGSIGRNVSLTVDANSSLVIGSSIFIGENVTIHSTKKIVIRDNVTIQDRCWIIGDVTIGNGTLIGANSYISSRKHFTDAPSYMPIKFQDKFNSGNDMDYSVHIGEDCWIGTNVVIMPNVKIARGAIIGANSVIFDDVLPYSVGFGIPYRSITKRLKLYKKIRVSNELINLPYFYEGFYQPINDSIPLHLFKPGIIQQNDFSIVINNNSRVVHVIIEAVCNSLIVVNNKKYKIFKGFNSIQIMIDDHVNEVCNNKFTDGLVLLNFKIFEQNILFNDFKICEYKNEI